jgi:hypothetical protein
MAMKAVVLEGDRPRSDWGGGVFRPLWERKGEGRGEAVAHTRADGGGIVAEQPEEEDKGVGPAHQ